MTSNGKSISAWIGRGVVDKIAGGQFQSSRQSLRQKILMAVARRRRVIVILVADFPHMMQMKLSEQPCQ